MQVLNKEVLKQCTMRTRHIRDYATLEHYIFETVQFGNIAFWNYEFLSSDNTLFISEGNSEIRGSSTRKHEKTTCYHTIFTSTKQIHTFVSQWLWSRWIQDDCENYSKHFIVCSKTWERERESERDQAKEKFFYFVITSGKFCWKKEFSENYLYM